MIFLPRVPWLILPVFSHRQRSMLSADETGDYRAAPEKLHIQTFPFPSDPPCSFSPLHFCRDTPDLSEKWSIGEEENYFADMAYCLSLNWQSAMSDGRKSLSREANLSLQSDELKDHGLSNQDTICGTILNVHKRVTNRRQFHIYGLPMHEDAIYFLNTKVKCELCQL